MHSTLYSPTDLNPPRKSSHDTPLTQTLTARKANMADSSPALITVSMANLHEAERTYAALEVTHCTKPGASNG